MTVHQSNNRILSSRLVGGARVEAAGSLHVTLWTWRHDFQLAYPDRKRDLEMGVRRSKDIHCKVGHRTVMRERGLGMHRRR